MDSGLEMIDDGFLQMSDCYGDSGDYSDDCCCDELHYDNEEKAVESLQIDYASLSQEVAARARVKAHGKCFCFVARVGQVISMYCLRWETKEL